MTPPARSAKPWYQTLLESHVPWFFAGFLAVGAILDTITNAYAVVAPRTALVCVVAAALGGMVIRRLLRIRPLPWRALSGQPGYVTRLGPRTILGVSGALFAVVLPLFFPRKPDAPIPVDLPVVAAPFVSAETSVPLSALFEEQRIEQRIPQERGEIVLYSVAYPQLRDPTAPAAAEFNRLVQSVVYRHVREYTDFPSLWIEYEVFSRNGFVAVLFQITHSGGAHPVTWFDNFAYDLRSGEVVSLGDLFEETITFYAALDRHLQQLNGLTISPAEGEFPVDLETSEEIEEGWYLTDRGLEINFDQCELDACVAGTITLSVPFAALRESMTDRLKGILGS